MNSLATENIQLRNRVQKTEKEVEESKKAYHRLLIDLKPFIENVDKWEDFLQYVHEREMQEADEYEQKAKAEITKQLEKEGYFKKTDEQIKKLKKQKKSEGARG